MEKEKALWPGWKTVRLIGRGSFGAVYEIERDNYGHKEKAALKVISIPQSASDIDDLVSDGYDEESITSRFEGYMQDIVREYSMMADMKGCANIVYCDDRKPIQHDDGMGWDIFIKMELLTALPRTLGKTVTDEQVIRIGMDICNALAFCEKRNVLHRDIKPQNIFVAPDGTYKLGDFGIAKTAERTTSGTKTGTYKYMAPEVYNNQPYGGKADIYSLGLVLYWLLNERRTPFLTLPPSTPTSTDEDKARARRFSGEQIPEPVHGSKELKRIVLKACSYDAKDRYQSAEEMLKDLNALGGRFESVVTASAKEPEKDKTISGHIPVNGPVQETEKTIELFEKTEETSIGSAAAEEEETVGAFSNPPQPITKPKKKKWPAILGGLVAVLVLAAGLYFLPGWTPATCDAPEMHKLLGITRGEALGHDWGGWTVVTEPGCTEEGLEQRICAKDPEHVETQPIAATGHNYTTATCTEPSVCTVCGEESTGAIGHDWGDVSYIWSSDNSSVTAKRTCLRCKEIEQETVNTRSSIAQAATCEEKGKTTYTSASFINSVFAVQTKTVTNIDALGHKWIEATYTSPQTCARCGKTSGSPLPTENVIDSLDGSWGENYFGVRSRASMWFKPWILDEPVENCVSLQMDLWLSYQSGLPYGTWYLYIRDLKGHWIHIDNFQVEKDKNPNEEWITYSFEFSDPIDFDAVNIYGPDGNIYYLSYGLYFHDVHVKIA